MALGLIWTLSVGPWWARAADPVVSNVLWAQRAGSRLVDVDYDVADADSPTLTVYLKVSADSGATWTVPVSTVTGAVGYGVTPDINKRLTWDAGKDYPFEYG